MSPTVTDEPLLMFRANTRPGLLPTQLSDLVMATTRIAKLSLANVTEVPAERIDHMHLPVARLSYRNPIEIVWDLPTMLSAFAIGQTAVATMQTTVFGAASLAIELAKHLSAIDTNNARAEDVERDAVAATGSVSGNSREIGKKAVKPLMIVGAHVTGAQAWSLSHDRDD